MYPDHPTGAHCGLKNTKKIEGRPRSLSLSSWPNKRTPQGRGGQFSPISTRKGTRGGEKPPAKERGSETRAGHSSRRNVPHAPLSTFPSLILQGAAPHEFAFFVPHPKWNSGGVGGRRLIINLSGGEEGAGGRGEEKGDEGGNKPRRADKAHAHIHPWPNKQTPQRSGQFSP